MNSLVKQIINDDGEQVPAEKQKWHCLTTVCGDAAMLCTGEFVDEGAMSGNGAEYVFKEVRRGGITCEKCLETVKEFKSIKF